MLASDKVLALRPANAAARLGPRNRVCVLNPRDVVRGAGGRPVPVFEALGPRAVAQGVLRAARHLDATVGLSAPCYPAREGFPNPYLQFQAAVDAAAEVGFRLPLYLRAGPISVEGTSERELSEASERVFQCVDAGFTAVCLDARFLEPEALAPALGEVSSALRERELSLEIAALATAPDEVAELLAGLAAGGVKPDALVLPPGAVEDAAALARLESAAAPCAIVVADVEGATLGALAPKRLHCARLASDILSEHLPRPLRQELSARAETVRESAGRLHRELSSLDGDASERVEAMAYHGATEILLALGVRGTASAAIDFLATRSGY